MRQGELHGWLLCGLGQDLSPHHPSGDFLLVVVPLFDLPPPLLSLSSLSLTIAPATWPPHLLPPLTLLSSPSIFLHRLAKHHTSKWLGAGKEALPVCLSPASLSLEPTLCLPPCCCWLWVPLGLVGAGGSGWSGRLISIQSPNLCKIFSSINGRTSLFIYQINGNLIFY